MGAMVSDAQRERAEVMVARSVEDGAELICGGHRPNRPGAFFEPTVIACQPDNAIAQKEVFGPVLSVLGFDDDDEAVSIANATDLSCPRDGLRFPAAGMDDLAHILRPI